MIYCAGVTTHYFEEWVIKKMKAEVSLSEKMKSLSFVADAALLATFFDYLMEPVAVQLGYWKWLDDGAIPLYNYVCWFFLSAFLLYIFKQLQFNRQNQFAVHLLLIQVLFFMALSIFL